MPTVDVSVDSTGRVYTVRWDGTLWLHDANGDQQVADLSTLGITDMEVGPDDKIYAAAGNTDDLGDGVDYVDLKKGATKGTSSTLPLTRRATKERGGSAGGRTTASISLAFRVPPSHSVLEASCT